MKKKVIFVITKSVWGGAGKYVYDLATNLPTDAFDIAVAAGGNGLLFQRLQTAGTRTIRIPELDRDIHIGKEFRSFSALRHLFEREQPDIIHLNSSKVGGLGALGARIAAWHTKKKIYIVFTVHGWAFLENRPLLWRAAAFLASLASTLFQDKIIFINSRDYTVGQKFIPKRRCVLIHNGLAERAYVPRETARAFFSQKIGREIGLDMLLIGTIAELTKNKGLECLVEAVNKLQITNDKLRILIMGEGEERSSLERQIRDAHLEEKVFLLGFVPDAAQYLSGLDIFVLPSRKEGLPYALMETMAAGIPVIASDVGGIPDLISSGETGVLVPPQDSEALAKAMRSLAEDPTRRAALAGRGKETVRTKFSLRAMLENTERLYNTL